MSEAANPLIQQVTTKVKEIESKLQDFYRQVNDFLNSVPDFLSYLIDPIQQGMQKLNAKIKEFWDNVNKMLFTQRGDSAVLKQTADQWAESVGNPAHGTAGDIALHKLRTNIEWEGRAAKAYKAIVPAQAEGLKGIKGLADQLRTSLTSLANAIDGFWTAISLALISFAVAIALAIAEVCGGVTAPLAIVTLLGAVGIAITLISAAVMQAQSLVNTIDTEQAGIKQKIHDLGDEWARTSVDLSDASTSDGDGSNWKVGS